MSRAYPAMRRLRVMWGDAIAGSEFADSVDVWLGPLVSGDPDDAVFIGYDGDPMGEMEMVAHSQDWAGIGQRAQNETFDIHCCILAMHGSTDGNALADAIDRLYRIWRVIIDPLKAAPHMGMGPGTEENAPVWTASIRGFTSYVPTDPERGVEPRITFDVHVETRV